MSIELQHLVCLAVFIFGSAYVWPSNDVDPPMYLFIPAIPAFFGGIIWGLCLLFQDLVYIIKHLINLW